MKLVRIWRDETCPSPREWDNLGTMVCWHRRYNLGDRHSFHAPDDFQEWARKADVAVILPLYLYDHGGITMSTKPFSCPWDSGQVGWIYVTKEKVREELMVKRVTRDVLRRVEEILRGEVDTYDRWLRGEVYGFTVYEVVDGDIVSVDSCAGFYGSDPRENGILGEVPDGLQEPLRRVSYLRDGLVVTETGTELEGREIRRFLLERGLLPGCVLEKCDVLRELCA
ncbi:hypothetical protein [Desulfofundulus sp.]|uniref:hypothetical protein n=1 Tax=Desulfofundulus sp. TaxID=2282750 RepID=UPI003C78E4B0